MHKLSLTLTATFVALAITVSAAGNVIARTTTVEQNGEQTQTGGRVCTTGYGQAEICTDGGTQTQKFHSLITYTDSDHKRSRVLGTHTPVNTAVDPSVLALVFATGLTGIAAFIGYTRLS